MIMTIPDINISFISLQDTKEQVLIIDAFVQMVSYQFVDKLKVLWCSDVIL